MAKKTDCRAYTVSVIGLSGTEKEKGQFGVGKSCLCNRFIHAEADLYHHEHISVLSQSDFGGRVINNDHFLYWGEVTKTDEGSNFTFHVIEQTEFVDDVSFQPFKTGRTDSYNKRCCQTKVQSAEKLMYICKDQLGMETDGHYEQKLMPDGRLNIDGILCCFDVSVVPQRTLDRQLKCCEELLHQAMKSKKPVVLVTTKSDQMNMDYLREIEKVLGRKEFKSAIPLVETSAHENVNVETPFLLLAHMMDKAKKQNKVIPYSEASKARKEVLHVAEEAFKNLLKNKITDFRCLWATARKKLEKESDYEHYVDMFGTERAKAQVKRHTRQLREDLVKRKQAGYLQRMPDVLKHFLPNLEAVGDRRSWHSCREQMYRDAEFDGYFVKVCEDDEAWQQTDIIDDNNEQRMPKSLLLSEEVETLFRNHVNALQAAQRREQAKSEFWSLMEKHIDKPGGLLSDYYTQFLGKPAFVELDEGDRQAVFDEFQKQLKARLRVDFQELLWERPSVFRNLNLNNNLTEDDLNVIYNSLNDDQRFRKFHKLEDDRKVMLLNHVVFLDKPTVDRCFFHLSMSDECRCTECQVSQVLRNERRLTPNGRTQPSFNSSGPIVRPLNLVILGRDGLASDLVTEIRSMCMDDEYKVAHRVYSLDYRPIEGDVSEEGNSFIAPNFRPDGCLCVYNSQDTLEYIRESLMHIMKTDQSTCLHNLPLVLMLAYEPYSQKELRSLQDDGRLLTTTLSCEFVDIPGEDLAEKLRFYAEQIEQAFNFIIRGPGHGVGDRIMEDTEPDLRLLLVMMCSDPYPMSLPLRPFLNEVSFVVTSDPETTSLCPEEDNVFTVDVTLDGSRQKVEVTVTSYHGAHLRVQKEYIYHGYILVYCPKRRASLASLKAFADTVTPALKIFIAIPEGAGSRYNVTEHSQGLKEGMDIAKNHKAAFLQASRNFETQTASQVYEKFLRDVWDHRDQVEDGYCNDSSAPPAYNFKEQRPPAPLPAGPYAPSTQSTGNSSNSQSTEDSEEPLYDQPHHLPRLGQQSSSPSPPPLPKYSPPPTPQPEPPLYQRQETPLYMRNDFELVKPSMVKEKRDQFAGAKEKEEYRKSFPSVDGKSVLAIKSGLSQSLREHMNAECAGPTGPFKKSISMKFAVKDDTEAWAINEPKRPSKKSSTFPAINNRDGSYDTHGVARPEGTQGEIEWTRHSMYDSYRPSSGASRNKYALKPNSAESRAGRVTAPLALPEKIEIAEQYGTVKDAVPGPHPECDYALVMDALPDNKIHRIQSTSRAKDKASDSEGSDGSSLERDKDLYTKVNRKPTPHKSKRLKKRSQGEGPYVTQIDITGSRRLSDHERVQGVDASLRGRSHSPSEDSTGTGDELPLVGSRPKRPSMKKIGSPGSNTNLSDSDLSGLNIGVGQAESDDSILIKVGSEDNDLNSSDGIGTWLRNKKGTPNSGMKTIDRKVKEEEKRRLRENKATDVEKKEKEKLKLQKKIKKKDSKTTGQSESGPYLGDFSMSPNNPSVPHFIEKCVEYIEAEGLHAEGIYRIPGNKAQGDLLTTKFHEDPNVDISTLEIQVNAVATTLKAFFADLTDPLVPLSLYDDLIEASAILDKSKRVAALRGIFLKMHPLNFEVLKFLITHLNKLSQNSEHNSMDSKNLSRCWWPTLLRMDFDSFEKMTKYSRIPEEILQTLIEECSYFFHSGNEI